MGLNLEDLASWPNLIAAILSINQLAVQWLAGNKRRAAWWLGLAGAAPWLTVMITSGLYGLLPLVIGLQIIYLRNLIKWTRAHRAQHRKDNHGEEEQ